MMGSVFLTELLLPCDAAVWRPLLLISLPLALLLDVLLGEPPKRLHPVVGMGTLLRHLARVFAPLAPITPPPAATESLRLDEAPAPEPEVLPPPLLHLNATGQRLAGTAAWLLGAMLVLVLAGLAQVVILWLALTYSPWLAALPLALLLKPLFAYAMLYREVRLVDDALEVSLAQGRQQLSRIVSRDTDQLSATEVREAAMATLAENFNDSVIAPLFWFVLAGLPGAALYRWANTADASWGYIGPYAGRDWTDAGRFAARADDVLSWLPARLCALLMMASNAALQPSKSCRKCLRKICREARKTPSPNSGWPMAAMAVLLNVRMGKAHSYQLLPQGRLAQPKDIPAALRICRRSWLGLMALSLLALTLCLLGLH